ncbi:PepSY domain-containing protein [Saccharibacillus brassicae]|uniref:PepSY domain-containing protein n=1 Tax=Saccharibacillus brassicae TaxID=2583377 RepID=A0A4Y6UV59_SACBS|nr:PepSY domain-containing protein [Saccharibacillus brassicae]QDH20147.1 hypothetical protein FFV09_04305 [Saccharibacillus brassicae]
MRRRTAGMAATALAAAGAAGLLLWSPWSSAEPSLTQAQAQSKLLKLYTGQIESASRSGDLYEMTLRTDTGLYTVKLYVEDGRVESIRRLEATTAPPREIVSRDQIKTRLEQQAGVRVERLELENADGGEERLYVADLAAASGERRRLRIDAYTGETLQDTVLPGDAPVAGGDSGGANGGDAGTAPSVPSPAGPGGTEGGNPPANGGSPEPGTPGNPGGGAASGGTNARLLSERQARAAAAAALGVEVGAVEESDAELRSEEDGQAYYLVDVELKNGRKAEVQINAVSGAMQTITWDEDEEEASQPSPPGSTNAPGSTDDEDGDGDDDADDDT